MNPTTLFPAASPTVSPVTSTTAATLERADEIATYATALETYHAVQHLDGIQSLNGNVNASEIEVGEIELKDRGWWWKIKVRWTSERGHYLKFECISDESRTFCALTRSFSPSDRRIMPDEWEIFAMLVDDRRNYALRRGAQKCLSRLTQKTPELTAATRE